MAFEQVHGPILLHDRLDFAVAKLCSLIANLWSKKRYELKDFLPPWYDVPLGDPTEGFARLLEMAEANNGGEPSPQSPR